MHLLCEYVKGVIEFVIADGHGIIPDIIEPPYVRFGIEKIRFGPSRIDITRIKKKNPALTLCES